MLGLAAAGPSAYWYLTRGTGTIALILLTASVALGVADVRRLRTEKLPRFVLDAIHRNASLLAMAFLIVHIATSVLDSFAPISLLDAVIPFRGTYRPLWVGFGALAFDFMLAVTVSSLVRRRLGYRAWRIIHWAAYASWPVALLHSVGTGSDTKTIWMLAITAGCVLVAVLAVVGRATSGWPLHPLPRVTALGAAAVVPVGLLIWMPGGPLAAGWAKKAGTPASLLKAAAPTTAAITSGASGQGPVSSSGGFTAAVQGSVSQRMVTGGLEAVDITLSLSGQPLSDLTIQLRGTPLQGGGLQMTSSSVSLGTPARPTAYRGQVTGLQGTNIAASVSNQLGHRLTLTVQLSIDQSTGSASGTVTATA